MPKLGWDLILPVHPKAFTLPQGSTSRQLDPLDADIWHRQIKWLHCCNVDIMLLHIFIPWLWSFKNSTSFIYIYIYIYIDIFILYLLFILYHCIYIVSKSAALDVVVVCRRGEATSDPLREAPTSSSQALTAFQNTHVVRHVTNKNLNPWLTTNAPTSCVRWSLSSWDGDSKPYQIWHQTAASSES